MTAGADIVWSVAFWDWKMCVVVGLSVALWASAADVQAQREPLRLQPLSPKAEASAGVRLLQTGRTDEARSSLKRAFTAAPALSLSRHGAVAYWLGKAHAQSGDSAQARAVWRRGYHRLADAGRFDVRLADAYLRTLTLPQLRSERLQAVDAYTRLLGRMGTDMSSALRPVYRRRMAQLAPLLPDDVFARVVEGERSAEPSTWAFRPRAGDTLRAWWRGRDPFPATEENERLEEHVTRLVRARQSFACTARPSSLDARGITHLRLGAPYKQRPLRYRDMEFFKEVFRFGVPLPPSAFPESEIWLYPQIDEAAYYLFAESDSSGCFRKARVNDLLPNTLKKRRNNSERGLNIAYSSLMAMRAIYGELALYHIDYSGRYTEIANYADYQEMQARAAKLSGAAGTKRQTTVGAGVGQTRTVTNDPSLGIQAPNNFVARMVSRADREDERAAERRKENTPRQHTALHEDTPELPVAVRTARFLNPEGTTRTEVYWGVTAADARLQPDEEGADPAPSMIRFSTAWHNRDRSRVERENRRIQLPAHPERQSPIIVADPVAFEGTTRHHLTMQWTQYQLLRAADSTVAGPGPKRRIALARADSLRPLRTERQGLDMSDLKVLSLPDTALAAVADPKAQATPYPFRTLTPETPLLLSFEVYHLTYGPDDRTDYRVSYAVKGETRQGWTRLLRAPDTQQTRTSMNRSGTARRTDEMILLDLSERAGEKTTDVRVTVRVTDEQTGATASRTLDFVLRPGGGS